jgi:glucose/arabinose dehydrogenase
LVWLPTGSKLAKAILFDRLDRPNSVVLGPDGYVYISDDHGGIAAALHYEGERTSSGSPGH